MTLLDDPIAEEPKKVDLKPKHCKNHPKEIKFGDAEKMDNFLAVVNESVMRKARAKPATFEDIMGPISLVHGEDIAAHSVRYHLATKPKVQATRSRNKWQKN